jgi:hypothetical protein
VTSSAPGAEPPPVDGGCGVAVESGVVDVEESSEGRVVDAALRGSDSEEHPAEAITPTNAASGRTQHGLRRRTWRGGRTSFPSRAQCPENANNTERI